MLDYTIILNLNDLSGNKPNYLFVQLKYMTQCATIKTNPHSCYQLKNNTIENSGIKGEF